jgi:hypothetical protein
MRAIRPERSETQRGRTSPKRLVGSEQMSEEKQLDARAGDGWGKTKRG